MTENKTPNDDRCDVGRLAISNQSRRQAAIALLDEWLADESGYDEEVWPILRETIEANRLSNRRRFP